MIYRNHTYVPQKPDKKILTEYKNRKSLQSVAVYMRTPFNFNDTEEELNEFHSQVLNMSENLND